MTCEQNYLVSYLKQHSIDVLGCTADQITVRTVFSKEGRAYTEQETIPASLPAVREYLGY